MVHRILLAVVFVAAGGRVDAAEVRLQDPALYSGPAQAISDAQKDKAWIERDLAAAEERWLEAQEAYEAAQAEEDADAG